MLIRVRIKDAAGKVKLSRNVGIMEVEAMLYTMGFSIKSELLESFLSQRPGNGVAVVYEGEEYAFRAS